MLCGWLPAPVVVYAKAEDKSGSTKSPLEIRNAADAAYAGKNFDLAYSLYTELVSAEPTNHRNFYKVCIKYRHARAAVC